MSGPAARAVPYQALQTVVTGAVRTLTAEDGAGSSRISAEPGRATIAHHARKHADTARRVCLPGRAGAWRSSHG
jgi:hypothetical protein